MTFANLMVHLEMGGNNDARLKQTAALADQFEARVIGITAVQPLAMAYGDGYAYGDILELDRVQTERSIAETEASFFTALKEVRTKVSWRSSFDVTPVIDYLADEARAADLIICGPSSGTFQPGDRRLNLGALLIQAGRPLLIVPEEPADHDLGNVVIGWKDSRETRRAIADALPLLRRAHRVTVVEISPVDDTSAARSHIRDVATWLTGHGISAEPMVAPSIGNDSDRLDSIAATQGAGLLVIGGYGHNRLREWVLGGVTRDMVRQPSRCILVSH